MTSVTPGWWLVAAVVAAQLLAEAPRHAMDTAATDVRRYTAAAGELRRRRTRAGGESARGVYLAARIRELRGLRARARRRHATLWLLLAVVWAGSQAACWGWDVNARWDVPRQVDESVVGGLALGVPVLVVLALWLGGRAAGAPAALDRAVAQLVYPAAGALLVASAAEADGPEGTTASVVVIAVSPLVRRVLVTPWRRAERTPLSESAAALVRSVDPHAGATPYPPAAPVPPPGPVPRGPAREQPQPTQTTQSVQPTQPVAPTQQPPWQPPSTQTVKPTQQPQPQPQPQPTTPTPTPTPTPTVQPQPTQRLYRAQRPTRHARRRPEPSSPTHPLIDLVPRADLVDDDHPLPGTPQHIRPVRHHLSKEGYLAKLFETGPAPGADGASGASSPQERPRNPVRRLAPYRELLSRVAALPSPARRTADRVLLWPRAVVGEGEEAVGVLYTRLAAPFLLRDGGAQTGDHLLAEEPDYAGCQVPSSRQRAELLLDVVSGHALLHEMGLAHGDTNWKNFVYGVAAGRGHGRLIDIDGVTSVDDPRPLLLHQPGWGDDPRMPPLVRDVYRVALLVARLAGPEPDWDGVEPPARPESWFTPWLRTLTQNALAAPDDATTAEFEAALNEALRT
ncbi:hypothetical protein [Streptomyces silvensis]|uniref:Protein kinase domain-containing protein n=1 Tax=Streptomyces silvensis TaxID=1765722 RepID=A0A0W7X5R8_9ACTN|nr:hypothetical protein [Streptomyces silvensis]KUF18220.1 hypothetical protein AT728_24910 [Streptomyces silvensis]